MAGLVAMPSITMCILRASRGFFTRRTHIWCYTRWPRQFRCKFSKFFGESSCTVRATCMLISDASSSSLFIMRLFNTMCQDYLVWRRENASCHVLCIHFRVGGCGETFFFSYSVSYRFHTFAADASALTAIQQSRSSGDGMWQQLDEAWVDLYTAHVFMNGFLIYYLFVY